MKTFVPFLWIVLLSSHSLASDKSPHRWAFESRIAVSHNDKAASWLAGGLGHFEQGSEDAKTDASFQLDAQYRYRPSKSLQFSVHAQGNYHTEPSSLSDLSLIEWEGRYRHALDFSQDISITFGQFFLPISMENTERFWTSPYTLTFSSLNSWIGEEFRPIGVDTRYRYHLDGGASISTAATLFGGNDSMGALLAYRGWSYGTIRTGLGDVLAIPSLMSLQDGQVFEGQRDDGTRPFGKDLDGKPGLALRAEYLSDFLVLSATWVDNQGDTELHQGEYAWRTQFGILGATWLLNEDIDVVFEASKGRSEMGEGPGVDIHFYSAYVLASYRWDEDYRISYRYDGFGVEDKDRMDEDNHDFGRSHTLALKWEQDHYRLGFEVLFLEAKRQRLLQENIQERVEGHQINTRLAVDYFF